MLTPPLRASAAAVPIPVHDESAATGILAPNQEAELRAAALALDAGERLCVVATDTLIVPPRVIAAANERIESELGVPVSHQLICATHTHHAPGTIDFLGCRPDEAFCDRLGEAIVEAARRACAGLEEPGAEAELLFAQSQEATVGGNSRYLLRDGTIAWRSYRWEDVIRPTGPHDVDMPVLALRRPSGQIISIVFSHAVHNIGALTPGMLSPGFYGLAAQELERRHGAVTLFLPGAFGSSHNTGRFGTTPNPLAVSPAECVFRVVEAVEEGLRLSQPVTVPPLRVIRRPFTWQMRTFDEAAEAAAVKYWTETYEPQHAEALQRVFADMRAEMAPLQGTQRQAPLQAIRLGEVALACLPGEIFARLGLDLRRRSPFRHTYVIGLANGTIGYVGDRRAYDQGGYQLWAGLHSPSAPGTGEAMITQALQMLRELWGD